MLIEGKRLNHRAMSMLSQMSNLQELGLPGCGLTDQLLPHLSGLPLRILDLSFNQIEKGCQHLNGRTLL
jgi:hypothetical protein